MKIVHVTGYFVEGMAYQENLLPLGQAMLGHDVVVVTGIKDPDFGFNRDARVHASGRRMLDGVMVSRIPQWFDFGNRGPVLRGLYAEIRSLNPDILFIHDVGPSLFVGLLYKWRCPQVRLHFDCHSDEKNARQSLFGPAYHWIFKMVFRFFGNWFESLFAVAPETVEFMSLHYGIPRNRISLLPLPGDSRCLESAELTRARVRRERAVPADAVVLIHTGKMPQDKETRAVLEAFVQLQGEGHRLWLVGHIEDHFKQTLERYIQKDRRIEYLGWVDASTLREYFVSSDLLVAPGSLSNTFIDAICARLPVLLDDTPQGRYLTRWGNGRTVSRGCIDRLLAAIKATLVPSEHAEMILNSDRAAEWLDFRTNAKLSLATDSHSIADRGK